MIKLSYVLDSVSNSMMHFINGKESMKLPMSLFNVSIPLTINADHVYRVALFTGIKANSVDDVYIIQGMVRVEDKPTNNILDTIKKWLIKWKVLPEVKLLKILLSTGIELIINEARIPEWDRPNLEVGKEVIMKIRR